MGLLTVVCFNALALLAPLAHAEFPSTDGAGYYGQDFLNRKNQLRDDAMIAALQAVLESGHLVQQGQADTLVTSCDLARGTTCVMHTALGYDGARIAMFGSLYLEQTNGIYDVEDVYCERDYSDRGFKSEGNIGPGMLPKNGMILNTEHTWPQSRFTGRFSIDLQKSDLHHLFPTDSQMNSLRSSYHFGYVTQEAKPANCPIGKLGKDAGGRETVFEAPIHHRGNVARALFYFSVRYHMHIPANELAALREWNVQDPVDVAEQLRNGEIQKLQGNRNPFIDFPELANQIQTF